MPAAAPQPSSLTKPVPGNRYGPTRGTRPSSRPDRRDGSPGRRRRDGRRSRGTAPAGRRAAPARSPAPGRRRCRTRDARSAHRVVQPAARMERVLDVATQDRLHRAQRAAGDGRRSIVHARERRIVAAPTDARLRRPERIGRQPLAPRRGSAPNAPAAGRRPAPAQAPGPARHPTARSRSMPGPNRRGVSGWSRPEVVRRRRGPKTRSGPSDTGSVARGPRHLVSGTMPPCRNASTPRRCSTSSASSRARGSRSSISTSRGSSSCLARSDARRHRSAAPMPDTDLVFLGGRFRRVDLEVLPTFARTHPSERRHLGRVAQGQGGDAARRRRDRGRARRRPGRQQGRRRSPRRRRSLRARDPAPRPSEAPDLPGTDQAPGRMGRTIRAWAPTS